ncbi:MAG: hypothetical protein LC541_10540 [Candidatus Thiodiazotropha sp.]|nr:hypothetical protein [Candidatus Thiodiazotropha sp.]MCM8883715.1 hypothetical protein [Candidatus Thiodiazotropha sp.]MCM8919280.1 hypothetical protein [Candidatus Thiodiazotropha sp.]
MSGLARFLIAFSLLFLLAACGGGDADAPWDGTTSTGSGQTIDDVGTGQAVILLGSGSGATFNAGVLSIAVTSLSAGGQTTITTTLADASGNLYQESATVTFASDCLASGLASMETAIDATGGVATTTYIAQGCSGADTIRATTTVNGSTTTASGTINVQPAEIGSMEFISAAPTLIGLRGVGLTEVSRVTFQVLDKNGNPVTQQAVSFSLNTNIGGASIPAGAETATSDINGLVGTDVKSGTIPTTVRVTASLNSNPLISTQSDGLVISTGISDQNSMTIGADVLNPEAWIINGVTVEITVHAADHFNNPVPNGTAVAFTTEGGQIQSQCQIEDGECTVTWKSANPRPLDDLLPGGMGRVTILATMLGEESFIDANGNGALDLGDTAFSQIPEAFRDENEDGVRDPVLEEFMDFDADSIYDGANIDPNYNGALCCDTAAVTNAEAAVAAGEDPGVCFGVTPITVVSCSSEKNIHVRESVVLVMGDTWAEITPTSGVAGGEIDIPSEGFTTATFRIVGASNEQVMPVGTTVSFSTTNGKVDGKSSFIVGNTNVNARLPNPGVGSGSIDFTVALEATPDDDKDTGRLTVDVTSPSGAIRSLYIVVND